MIINKDSHNEEEIMNEIIKEMGYDSKSILQQKYNVNTGKLALKNRMQGLEQDRDREGNRTGKISDAQSMNYN